MSMNIKNEEAHRLAKELAAETGETVTAAVTVALRERLERLRSKQSDRHARLLAITEEVAALLPESERSIDHTAFLYDERGLPK